MLHMYRTENQQEKAIDLIESCIKVRSEYDTNVRYSI
jgi:hypothetical protein